jgi:protein tyrosine/serine phosphatase
MLAMLLALMGCAPSRHSANPLSDSQEGSGQGLPNLIRVSDRLYRGGQPSSDGLKRLKEMGVKTVVCLRSSRGVRNRETEECRKLGLRYEQLTMPAFGKVPGPVVQRFFELVESAATAPVFIHCLTGTDRVGVLAALYRIREESWSADRAYEEMKRTGFNQMFSQYRKYVYNFAAREKAEALRANGSSAAPTRSPPSPTPQ